MDRIWKLIYYDDKYYNEGTSPISDGEYDRMKEGARRDFPNHEYFKGVGSPVKNGKVKLPFVLGSLNKAYRDDIGKWLLEQEQSEFLVTEKLDGVDFIVIYFYNQVVFAATRGDGYYGQDITEKAKIFCPDITGASGIITFRGQAMLLDDIHKTLTKSDGSVYKTARNCAAGILNHKNSNIYCEHITPFFFEIIQGTTPYESEYVRYARMSEMFNNIPEAFVYVMDKHTEMDLGIFLEKCKKKNYEVDGLVITPMFNERENVPYPSNKVAFKVNDPAVLATVRDIEWNVSRTGRIVPVVIVDPIEIQGVTITRATGFNAEFIQNKDITKGDSILLERAGDVIPYIIQVVGSKMIPAIMPSVCPSCDKEIGWHGVDLLCTNPLCGEQAYYRVEHFLRRMGAENITYKTLMKLGLDTIQKCYEIEEWDIATMDGFGVKRAQVIVDEIQGTLYTTFDKFIAAYGIPGVGRTLGKVIASKHKIQDFFELGYEDFMKIDGVGEILARNIEQCKDGLLDLYYYLDSRGLRFEESGTLYEGVQFTLTGTGPIKRSVLQSMISRAGGIVKGISKKTDYLVIADPESQSSKAKKARQYGIEIISYEQLMEMLGI